MSLKRITLATETLQEFVSLSAGKQKIIAFLLSKRKTNYFSYKDIAEATGLKLDSVRVLIMRLTKQGWITRQSERTQYTPQGTPSERQFRWCLTKVIFQLEESYKREDEAEVGDVG